MTGQTCTWVGRSGSRYAYEVHPLGTPMRAVPGNYGFAKVAGGRWVPLYFGQTFNLRDRLENHERERCARMSGATHIHVHANGGGEAARRREEGDLIGGHSPHCNRLG